MTITLLKGRPKSWQSNGISIHRFAECFGAKKLKIQNMSKILKIGFIGGGKMAQALGKGIVSAGCVVILLLNFDFREKNSRGILAPLSVSRLEPFFIDAQFN